LVSPKEQHLALVAEDWHGNLMKGELKVILLIESKGMTKKGIS